MQSSFLPELRVQPADSLGQLNAWFTAWCEEHYHRRVHRETGEPPIIRWQAGSLHRSVSWEALQAAFQDRCERTVDKTGQVQWQGRRWLVPEGLLQCRVELRWDPHAPATLAVWYENQCYGHAVAADQAARPTATPVPEPRIGPGLSYLTILAQQQAARQQEGIDGAAWPPERTDDR